MPEKKIATPADALYLDLLKKTLTFSLWPEPPRIVKDFEYPFSWRRRMLLRVFRRVFQFYFARFGLTVTKVVSNPGAVREVGGIWPAFADTMIGMRRLDNLQFCIETALKDEIPGDFIETGVWRGGACIFMRGVLAVFGVTDRRVFVADSFQGLPKPDPAYPVDAGAIWHTYSYLAVSRAEVEQNFRRYGLLDEQVVFLEGWFQETLPAAPIDKLAIARLDGDMYGSTLVALENLYPKLSSGGFCIIDDYALASARAAVMDYRKQHGIEEPIVLIDQMGAFWRKA